MPQRQGKPFGCTDHQSIKINKNPKEGKKDIHKLCKL